MKFFPERGSGDGTVTSIASADGSITVTNSAGPAVGLSSGWAKTVKQSADVTEASSTNPVDITGLTVDLPRAGTYHVTAILPYTAADSTSRTHGIGVIFSGSASYVSGVARTGSTNSQAAQTVVGTLGAAGSQTTTTGRFEGQWTIVTTTTGTLKMQFSRSAASIAHLNGIMTVREGA